jgi:hypothetical protein
VWWTPFLKIVVGLDSWTPTFNGSWLQWPQGAPSPSSLTPHKTHEVVLPTVLTPLGNWDGSMARSTVTPVVKCKFQSVHCQTAAPQGKLQQYNLAAPWRLAREANFVALWRPTRQDRTAALKFQNNHYRGSNPEAIIAHGAAVSSYRAAGLWPRGPSHGTGCFGT